jgi:hypothetical protein
MTLSSTSYYGAASRPIVDNSATNSLLARKHESTQNCSFCSASDSSRQPESFGAAVGFDSNKDVFASEILKWIQGSVSNQRVS